MDLIERVTIDGSELTVRPNRRLKSLLPFDFKVSYEPAIDLAALPWQIALLPFLWNVAPIVWATGQEFEVDVLDPRVAASFDAVRDEFRAMYPSLAWDGSIRPRDITEAPPPPAAGLSTASLFSGGVDSTWTALSHAGTSHLLITIWGADVRQSDRTTWARITTRNAEFAARHAGGFATATSNFKSINYPRLNTLTREITNWWSFVQLSPGLLGLTAPILYAHGVPIIYVAASLTAESAGSYASQPRIDNRVSLATAEAEHDSFDLSRQDRIKRLVDWQKEMGERLTLRVCLTFVTREGGNCGQCEKCLRTMVGLVQAGADPTAFGFPDYRRELLDSIPGLFATRRIRLEGTGFNWRDPQAHARTSAGLEGSFWSWLREFDFATYRRTQRPGRLSWERIDPLVARAPRVVAIAREARRLVRRIGPR